VVLQHSGRALESEDLPAHRALPRTVA